MVITYFGKSYFKLTLGDLTIAINPPSKDSVEFSKAPRFGADIALITTHTVDTDGSERVTFGDKIPFVIDGPGSYEVRELFFVAAASKVIVDNKEHFNTVYGFELDGIKIAFLGLLGDDKALSSEIKEIAASADMLFVPVSSGYKTAVSFSPNVIIPYDYEEVGLEHFLKDAGQDKNEAQDKATLKRRDLDGKQGHVLVLTAQV